MAVAVVHKTILEKQGPIWPKDNSLSTSILEHVERMKVCDETVTVGTTFFFFFLAQHSYEADTNFSIL